MRFGEGVLAVFSLAESQAHLRQRLTHGSRLVLVLVHNFLKDSELRDDKFFNLLQQGLNERREVVDARLHFHLDR